VASNYVLETTTSFKDSRSWTEWTNSPAVEGDDLRIDVATAVQSRFFRLKHQLDFYGRKISFLKLLGQERWGDISPGPVTGQSVFHCAGVAVDRSSEPNHIYVADTGNSRILGFRAYGTDRAVLVLGQPDEFSGAANGDCILGLYGGTTASNLCLLGVPSNPNTAEQWMRLNFDVDQSGNLYVPDFGNNRVLIYYAPFSPDTSGGKGDAVADFVIGQDDFSRNLPNRGQGNNVRDAQSLFLSYGGFDHVSCRGVSVDSSGDVWVADTFNYRVLRFPRGSTTANLVLGQPDFTNSTAACLLANHPTNAPLNRTCTPVLARVDPETGELYVIDEFPGGFRSRILVFTPPFRNGMAAARMIIPKQPLAGDYRQGCEFKLATGLIFNPFKTDDAVGPDAPGKTYKDGKIWVHAWYQRVLLLQADGTILQAIGAPDINSHGGWYSYFGRCGQSPFALYTLIAPGGMIGCDSSNRLYFADEHLFRVSRYALPYRTVQVGTNWCMPADDGGLLGHQGLNELGIANDPGPAHIWRNGVGVSVHQGQLFVRDFLRYMIWTNYLSKPDGANADFFVGQPNGFTASTTPDNSLIRGRTMHAVDGGNRLWTLGGHDKLLLFQLPFQNNSVPLRGIVPLFWADNPNEEVDYGCGQAIAYDQRSGCIWIFDRAHYRLLRICNPGDWAGKLLVDCVIGQTNKFDGALNRGLSKPDAASFGDVSDIRFDRQGNMFIVDNAYECHPNGRVIGFLAADLAGITNMFPSIQAKKLYGVESFDQTRICRIHDPIYGDTPFSPVSLALNSRGEMVIGNDGYHRDPKLRQWRQLYLYRTPLTRSTPDAVIELPLGSPGEITFDHLDNLIVQDHTYNRIWIINFDLDPAWLRPLPL
jgi:hypothetical protein